jgi:hypothetical protein
LPRRFHRRANTVRQSSRGVDTNTRMMIVRREGGFIIGSYYGKT